MARVKISKGKFEKLQACSDEQGIIAALAVDQRGALKKSFSQYRAEAASNAELSIFKQRVTQILSPYASAILLDPEYGLPAVSERASGCGVLLAYEKTGYDASIKGRLPDLLSHWSVLRLLEAGSDGIKILLYYNPFDEAAINEIKQVFVERVGAECAALDIPFYLEPLAYDDRYDEKSLEFARLKPGYVTAIMQEFSKERYSVDILKVELPFNSAYLAGSGAFKGGESAYDRAAAIDHLRTAATAASKPFIYLSAGVDDTVFRESLELAAEAEVTYSGVLCGRATWKGGIQAYVEKGEAGLETWLGERGTQNIQSLNAVVKQGAQPWYTIYGGLDNLEIIG
jgi:tagatose 1,6-diphosphate aldolase